MTKFSEWLLTEATYYHGTSLDNAKSILSNGIDPNKYRSGMFKGFYLAPSLSYFGGGKTPEVILRVEVDDTDIIDVNSVKDEDIDQMNMELGEEYPRSWRMMSYGYKNSLIEKWAKRKGYSGVRNGKEVILFSPEAVKSIGVVE